MDSPAESGLLSFVLTDGVTSREDTLLLCGAPVAQFEGNRVVVHRFVVGKGEKLQPFLSKTDEMQGVDRRLYDLVLVFENNIVRRHSLVRVR